MTITAERSMVDLLMDGQQLGLPASVHFNGSGPLKGVGLDNGNGRIKGAVFSEDGHLVTDATPAVYKTAREIRGGAGIVSYDVNDGTPFWIGDEALKYEGDALPIGSTSERINDQRQRDFLAAVIVELLLKAGYKAGIHNLALGFAIPNDEIVVKQKDNRLGVAKETREALKTMMQGKTSIVRRLDAHGQLSMWTLTYSVIVPQAQSLGTYLMWRNSATGMPIDNGIEALTVIDIGTGDLQRTDIDVAPYRLMGEKIGRGTILMARQLAQRLPQLKLNDAQATNALIHRSLRINGRRVDISDQVQTIVAAEGQDIVSRILPALQQTTRFVLFTGGGVLFEPLRQAIIERATVAGKEEGKDYAIVPHDYALALNAVGALVAVAQSGR